MRSQLRRWRVSMPAVTSLLVLAPVVVVGVAAPAAAGSVLKPAPKEASTERAALAAAASSDERVEVTEYRSETTQVFADPDGHLTLESTAVPQRVHTADGQWSPVDLGLRAASDGSLRPGARLPMSASPGVAPVRWSPWCGTARR